MKTIKHYILIGFALLFSAGCDKDFVEVNTNPYALTSTDAALLFAGSQRSHLGNWGAEHTLVQQFVTPYNAGATLGFNFNADIDLAQVPKWNQAYPTSIRNMMQALSLLGDNTTSVNLQSMIRIWKAQVFMSLVDQYGNVPYFQAGKAVSEGIFYPAYDDDELIYEDLYTEITEALAALDPGADFVSADLFYGAKASIPVTTPAVQVAQWKKLGNSLLLRLGMRYSKINPAKAEDIAAEAFAGGVMTSNADNAYVKYDGINYVFDDNNGLRNNASFNYAAEPFVDQLKSTNDPRAKFMIAMFVDPKAPNNELNPDTDLANQFGVPIGVTDVEITSGDPAYRGANPNGGLAYSQFNLNIVAAPNAPAFYVTYAQTSLLLAEAAKRGWIPGGDAQAEIYYENAITSDMRTYALYPGTPAIPISDAEIDAYLNEPGVAYNATDALELINTQYWIVNLRNGTEAFANFRRSEFPALSPNDYVGNLDLQGGFIRRFSYPEREASANSENYLNAAAAMDGDNLLSRVFWDVQ